MTHATPVRLLLAAALVLGAAACSSDGSDGSDGSRPDRTTSTRSASTTTSSSTTTPAAEPIADQTAPKNINGIEVQGDTLWVASIDADEILQVRRRDGAILARFPTNGAGPDDLAIAPDGSVYSAGFANGDVGHIDQGRYTVVTKMAAGINPIAFSPDGKLFIGTYGPGGKVYEVPLDGSSPVEVATDAPDINAFGILEDGTIVAPSGGVSGPGAAVAIDPDDGTITQIVGSLPPVAAGTTDADGTPFVLANLSGQVIEVDVDAGTSRVVRTVGKGAPFDNLSFAEDGTLYLSTFGAPSITEVKPDGATRVIHVGR